ncbi:PREDICTED: LOW QUALITY PROTEIN: putative F-box protein At1g57580 [Camelina sativa]|uniref:LOW QUALITY PROTEIN: putative F-box protein At1g57580 n=1 Tax=Camelina sativa TaxID=90675 RepID=A0ABM0X5X8_CAMSA|nr:PREDICTED: LOW QUALITY PROTEIN: putative F-box protein At1g57580 [Camelina sativa]
MDSLPWHLLEEILFRIDHRSLAMMQCTNRSLQSHISKNPNFDYEYFTRVRSSLLCVCPVNYGSRFLCYDHIYGTSRSPRRKETLMKCHLLGYSSGLLLLFYYGGLYVVNPLTKKFRLLNNCRSHIDPLQRRPQQKLGFAVDQIDRTTKSFKIVIINEGSLHWLRTDGSIVAFNPKTEKARLIPIRFPKELRPRTLFTAADNNLTLISATEKVTYVYALENILSDPKWVLVKQIPNGVLDVKRLIRWYPEAYDGKCLVLRRDVASKKSYYEKVVHVYEMRANKWEVIGSTPVYFHSVLDFYQFTPSLSSVIGLDD